MNKEELFQTLAKRKFPELLDLLSEAYNEMDTQQRRDLFGHLMKGQPVGVVDGEDLLVEIKEFSRESLAQTYYAPFDINSKNFMHVPEETGEWFEKMGDLLQSAARLTAQGDHVQATICFRELYTLIGRMEDGEEIVFGDEVGSWMIPVDEKVMVAAYLISLAEVASPEEFAEVVVPLVRRDSWYSHANQIYASAIRVANDTQRERMDAEIARQKIRVA